MWPALTQCLRSLRRRAAYASFAFLLLALGIGAASAIFAVVDGTLLRPLPYADPGSLVALTSLRSTPTGTTPNVLSALELVRWRERARAFSGVEGYSPVTTKLSGSGNPEALAGMNVSAGFIDLLGVPPARGRGFRREEEVAGSGVAIISYALWQRRFGLDPAVLGRTVTIDDAPRTIVGIMPRGYSMLFQQCDVWLPMVLTPDQLTGPARIIAGIARLRAGATVPQGIADLAAVSKDLATAEPELYRLMHPDATPLRDSLVGSQRLTLFVLLCAVVALVAIGAANVAGLAAADAVANRVATTTRLAFGASRGTIVRLRVKEGAVLSAIALPPGLVVGAAVLSALRAINDGLIVGPGDVFTAPVIAFAVGIAVLMGVVTMLPAAFGEASLGLSSFASVAAKATEGRAERRSRDGLLTAQVAVTIVLLVAAAVLTRNLNALLGKSPGFDAEGVLVAPLASLAHAYPTVGERALQVERVLAAVRDVPGVKAAATIQTRFLLGENMQTAFEIDGRPAAPDVAQIANIRHSSSGVFNALHTRIVAGRGFDETDRESSRLVAVVSQSFAKQYWGSASPLGSRLRRANRADAPWMEVIGVAEDVNDAGAGVEMGPTLYVSYLQQNTALARVTLIVRTSGDPAAMADAVRRAVWTVDPDQAIESVTPLTTLMLRSAADPRVRALVVMLFGAAALLLVLSGVYASTQYAVSRSTRELGVRAALGAPPSALLTGTVRKAVRPAVIGLGAGVLLAIPTVGALQQTLGEQFTFNDAPLILGVFALFLALTLIAAVIPARRVVRISPIEAIRA